MDASGVVDNDHCPRVHALRRACLACVCTAHDPLPPGFRACHSQCGRTTSPGAHPTQRDSYCSVHLLDPMPGLAPLTAASVCSRSFEGDARPPHLCSALHTTQHSLAAESMRTGAHSHTLRVVATARTHVRMHVQDPVPASEATDVTTLDYPGVSIRARSVPELSADGSAQPRRIPTVFAPFHAGVKFALGARQAPPGVTLHISNVTLLLPNVTYSGVFESGFMDFFEMGRFARMCFTDRCRSPSSRADLLSGQRPVAVLLASAGRRARSCAGQRASSFTKSLLILTPLHAV